MCLFSLDYSTSFLFFSFILFPSPYFYNCTDTYFWDVFPLFLYFIFWFCCAFFHFFHFLDHLVLPSLVIHSFACPSSFLFYFPSSQPSSFSQHWNTGDSHPEELEWLGAHPRFQTRSQPPLLHSFTSSQPQFTDCVAVSEHSIPGGQITLQVKIEFKNKKEKKKQQNKKHKKQKSAWMCIATWYLLDKGMCHSIVCQELLLCLTIFRFYCTKL